MTIENKEATGNQAENIWEKEMDAKADAFFRTVTGQATEGDVEVAKEVADTMKKATEVI